MSAWPRLAFADHVDRRSGSVAARGIVLSGEVDDGWRALLVPAGLILIVLGVRPLRDRHAWMAFVESQSKVLRHPSGQVTRRFTGIGLLIIGLGWMIGGVVGLYDLVGRRPPASLRWRPEAGTDSD